MKGKRTRERLNWKIFKRNLKTIAFNTNNNCAHAHKRLFQQKSHGKKFIKKAPRNIPVKPILKFCVLNPQINNDILHTIPIDKHNLLFCDRNRKLKSIDGLVEMNWVALRCIALFLEILLPNNIAYTCPSNLEMKIIFCKFSKTFAKFFATIMPQFLVQNNATLYCTYLILFENNALDGWLKVTSS